MAIIGDNLYVMEGYFSSDNIEPEYLSNAFARTRKECGLFNEAPSPKLPCLHEIRSLSGKYIQALI